MPNKGLKPPVAERIPKKMEIHGDVRIDDYYWLNERENKKVIDYLNAENDYYDSVTGHTKKFQEDLFEEMKSRIKEDDESVPYKKNGYFYITRYEKGSQYPVYTRKKENLEAKEEIIVDVNELAKGHEYYALTSLNVNRANNVAAFGVDTISRRQYDIMFKNLENGRLFPEVIKNTTGSTAWSNDNKTVFYAKKDPVTLRSDKIYKHILGTDASEDELIFEEQDETFWTFVYKSKSQKYIIIGSYSTLSTEYRFLDADKPEESFRIIQPRQRELEYSVAHYGDDFYILTNHGGATNFKLMKTPVEKTGQENWVDVIPHRENTLLEDISIFKDFLVLEERTNGLNKIRIKRWHDEEDFYLPFDEETYTASVYNNPEFDTHIIRYSYNSLTTPNSVIDFNVDDKSKEVKKEQEVLGGNFDKNNYTSERLWATARDGKKVAVSLVYRKSTEINENTPLLLYGYGSYGSIVSDRFSSVRLSLLDRGFVYAIAHIRGGEYLGRAWYEDGKMFNKINTFYDFIDVGKFLIEQKYSSASHLYAEGGSAGGLLMGAVINLNPEIFNGIIAAVPFVDVVTTMLDEDIPLTTGEFDEWGNPKNKDSYEYMLSYSPYDNVKKQDYPHMLVTTGLHDSQVQYFEPAKWVAKLRVNKTDDNKLLLYTNMETGHGGASGRFDALKEVARDYCFLLDLEGITE
ncbi:S9 family peptidase [Lutimonas saemankumensis]|nr:S9 family peptidase [Lutimonas saemankumensis]MCA0932293.1 S9 family peptidase [Lutimonas saemankumensis]